MRGLALPWRGQMKDEVAIWPEDSADRSARMLLCVLTGDGAGAQLRARPAAHVSTIRA